ncbi:MAG: TetR/AcrR family transcriptional regulator [Polyangiaceae bacterium]|nr:TetR/AcrR family transcriptional regulator [Polyangiaceae bacterium]
MTEPSPPLPEPESWRPPPRRRRPPEGQEPGREGDAVQRILSAAEACFRSAGYSGVSLREIAEAAGVSKSLVLYHFDSKDHVFAELQLLVYRRLAQRVREAVAGAGGTTVERALLALDSLMAAVRDHNDLAVHAMLGARALTSDGAAPHVRRMRKELRGLLHGTMQELFGGEAERLPLSVEACGDLLWAALTGLGLQSVLDDSPQDLERGFESLRQIVRLAFQGAPEALQGGLR